MPRRGALASGGEVPASHVPGIAMMNLLSRVVCRLGLVLNDAGPGGLVADAPAGGVAV